jgi:hypothetical protein
VTFLWWIVMALSVRAPSLLSTVATGIFFILLFSCWIGALAMWRHVQSGGAYHMAAFFLLIPFGLLWGWAYILAAAGTIPCDNRST